MKYKIDNIIKYKDKIYKVKDVVSPRAINIELPFTTTMMLRSNEFTVTNTIETTITVDQVELLPNETIAELLYF